MNKRQQRFAQCNSSPTVLTIGNFDGVHPGHRSLLADTRDCGDNMGISTTALTFDPTPAQYFARKSGARFFQLLNTDDKVALIRQCGIHRVLVLPFDSALRAMTAETFFVSIIVQQCLAQAVVVGDDFRFGKNRSGDTQLLQKLCAGHNIHFQSVALEQLHEHKISSSVIRQHLINNRIAQSNQLLGYKYFIRGRIVTGDGRGRQIGYATANLKPLLPIPLRGVFATSMQLPDGRIVPAVTNIGNRPTFDGNNASCETHLFDFDEDIYNAEVTLTFHTTIREEKKFASIDELRIQIEQDVQKAKRYMAQETA